MNFGIVGPSLEDVGLALNFISRRGEGLEGWRSVPIETEFSAQFSGQPRTSQDSCRMRTRFLSRGVKRLGPEAKLSSTFSDEVRYAWSYTPAARPPPMSAWRDALPHCGPGISNVSLAGISE